MAGKGRVTREKKGGEDVVLEAYRRVVDRDSG
jgi:hypothetical protein